MLPGDRLICALVEQQKVGTKFKNWFLHVTIVPWFRLDEGSEQIVAGLKEALRPIVPFKAKIEGEASFGPNHDRTAHLLDFSTFSQIERRVRNYLQKKRAWLVDETTKVKPDFRPHVTFQAGHHLKAGDSIFCDRLYIVEQKGEYKEIVGEVRLNVLY